MKDKYNKKKLRGIGKTWMLTGRNSGKESTILLKRTTNLYPTHAEEKQKHLLLHARPEKNLRGQLAT